MSYPFHDRQPPTFGSPQGAQPPGALGRPLVAPVRPPTPESSLGAVSTQETVTSTVRDGRSALTDPARSGGQYAAWSAVETPTLRHDFRQLLSFFGFGILAPIALLALVVPGLGRLGFGIVVASELLVLVTLAVALRGTKPMILARMLAWVAGAALTSAGAYVLVTNLPNS